jgi:DNA repair protein REV1
MGYADDLQAVSVDEALIDASGAVAARELAPEEAKGEFGRNEGEVTGEYNDVGSPEPNLQSRQPRDWASEVAEKIRDDVRAQTGCEGQ